MKFKWALNRASSITKKKSNKREREENWQFIWDQKPFKMKNVFSIMSFHYSGMSSKWFLPPWICTLARNTQSKRFAHRCHKFWSKADKEPFHRSCKKSSSRPLLECNIDWFGMIVARTTSLIFPENRCIAGFQVGFAPDCRDLPGPYLERVHHCYCTSWAYPCHWGNHRVAEERDIEMVVTFLEKDWASARRKSSPNPHPRRTA